jgi:hypothetical protein
LVQKTPLVKVKVKVGGTSHLENIQFSEHGSDIQAEDEECDLSDYTGTNDDNHETALSEKEKVEIIDLSTPVASFPFNIYHANEKLIQAFFCSEGRRTACARCKLGFKSVLWCRATSGHDNPDFIFLDYLEGIGGVSGLVNILSSDATAILPPQIIQPVNTAMQVLNQDESLANQNTSLAQISDTLKPEVDHIEVLQKAEAAFELAKKINEYSHSLLNKELELSEEFIRDTFSIDPTDGHYEVCIKCGRGGDILCCETCPTVCHYQCVGLQTIPEADWTCWKCLSKGPGYVNATSVNNDSIPSLSEMINDLRSMRSKNRDRGDKTKPSENGDATSDSGESSSESESDESDFEPEVGSELMKVTERGNISAEIVTLPTRRSKLYRVLFADGTLEYIPENDVRQFRSNYLEDMRQKLKASKGRKTSSSKRGRPPTHTEQISIDALPPEPWPRPGFVTTNMRFYACLVNDTYAKVARKVGLRYWYQIASVVDNHVRYGKDYHAVLLEGALVRLPPEVDETLVKALVDPNLPADTVKVRTGRKLITTKDRVIEDKPADSSNRAAVPFPPVRVPKVGFIDIKKNYYCCEENDTCVKIARKLGCSSWRDIASLAENVDRYGSALQDEKTRFRKGTLLRIPFECDRKKVLSLIDRSSGKST